jgi:enoyl-CoA hydratase
LTVRVEREGAVTTITIDRPGARNAVDRDTAAALHAAFEGFAADDAAHVAVLTGAGGHFCAGADLKAIADGRPNRVEPDGPGPMGPTRMLLDKPVIAAVEGYAVAGGLELALWCDLRVVAESAVFGVFCRRWGVPLIDGGTIRLPRLVGRSRALDLILTGRPVHADEALAMGLANRVVPDTGALAAARSLAADIARFPQTCMRGDRRSCHEQAGMDLQAALRNELRHGMAALQEAAVGAGRFSGGAGRGGSLDDV